VLSSPGPGRAEDLASSPLDLALPQSAVGESQPVTRRPRGLPPAGPAAGRRYWL